VAWFSSDEVKLVAGRGEAARVRAFGESEFPGDPSEVLPAVRRRFEWVSEPLVMARPDVERWLERIELP
jgi:hypothetical protein